MREIAKALAAVASLLLSLTGAPLAHAQSIEQFYQNKQIRFIVHSTPGGAYDGWTRLLGPYFSKYLPGNPVFVPQNMPGAGGLTATNYLFTRAPQDGSVIGMVGRNIPSDAVFAGAGATFDPRRFHWIGNPERGATVAIVTGNAGVRSARDLFEREVLFGGAGAGSAVSQMPLVISRLLGMKFRLVEGYGSQSAITLALQREEIHGTFATLTSVLSSFPGAVESGKLHVLFNLERKPVPELKAPSIFEFAKTEEERQILALLAVSSEVGRPILAPPGTPPDRVAALRRAFEDSMKDPQLQAAAAKMGLPIDVVSGTELQDIVNELMATPAPIVEKMRIMTRQ